MKERRAARLAWAIAFFCFAMVAAGLVLLFLNRTAIAPGNSSNIAGLLVALTFGALGALVASRKPRNPIGWLMLGIAATVGVSSFATQIATRALLAGVSPLGWSRWPAWVDNWVGQLGIGGLILVFLLFPDGKPLSWRWRWVVWTTVLASIGFTAGSALDPTPVKLSPHLPSLRNPVGVRALAGFSNSAAFLLILILFVLAMVALIRRLRRSRGEERQQIKWFAYATGISVGALVAGVFLSGVSQTLSNVLFNIAFAIGFAVAVPAAAALAILRYGLYEVDVVINKTVVYFSLAAAITAIYVGIVVGVGAAINARGNVGLSLLATAVVAVGFQPIRERSRRFANRLVYGKRATPYEVLSEFAERMAGTYSLEDVLPRTARLLAEGTGAVRADVWLRVGSELRAEGSWPASETGAHVALTDAENLDVPGATTVVPVRHQGDLLGALSIQKPPNDPLTPAEEKLLSDVASQAGLVLKNVRLIEDLRASRQRLVKAQDEERRKIERNIHDGAQQQLVALAVRVNLVDRMIDGDRLKGHEMLANIKSELGEALENLRDLARGIYPPLLADKGLAAALESQARKSPIPVTVESDGIGRYPQEVEAAVYFCCLEALQNIAKYAEASLAIVRLTNGAGMLMFEVTDDGHGFDPAKTGYGTGLQGMADRLDALGGSIDVRSAPEQGTTVVGRVPGHQATK